MKKDNFINKIAKIIYKNKISLLKTKMSPKKFANYNADLSINEFNPALQAEKVEKIIQKYSNDPKKLVQYIKGAKTPIYEIKNANKVLSKINEKEGFIMPQTSLAALYLNLVLNKKISFKTPEMFVISKEYSPYLFCYEFYKWYCYKTNTKGYDIESQKKYKNIFNYCETSKIDELSFDEIIELKTAIKRDIEAINFVKNYSKKYFHASEKSKKLQQGNAIQA